MRYGMKEKKGSNAFFVLFPGNCPHTCGVSFLPCVKTIRQPFFRPRLFLRRPLYFFVERAHFLALETERSSQIWPFEWRKKTVKSSTKYIEEGTKTALKRLLFCVSRLILVLLANGQRFANRRFRP